jgi:NAD/NADP transhydrogenase beta subunit
VTVLSQLWGIVAAVPFVGGVLAYAVLYAWKRDRRFALRGAVNVTNVLLIYAVSASLTIIWPNGVSAWWWIAALFAAIALSLGWMQWKVRGRVALGKLCYSTWRLSFILLSLAYVFLFTAGVWKYLQAS